MRYTIIHARDNETMMFCDRCGASLVHGVQFFCNGERIMVGRECAKHYGIVWTPSVGPCADDPETYRLAVALHARRNADRPAYRWPDGWQELRDALGSIAWKRAQIEASK